MTDEEKDGALGPDDIGEIYCSREEFERLRQDPQMKVVLELARLTNVLRFFQMVVVSLPKEDSPTVARQRLGSFLLFSAHLHEAIELVRRFPREVKEMQVHKDGMMRLLRSAEFKSIETFIRTLRNKIGFHLDAEVMPLALERLSVETREEYIFARLRGRTKGETYYDLADEAVFAFLAPQGSNTLEELKPLIATTTDVAIKFEDAAGDLIVAILRAQGWRTRVRRSSSQRSSSGLFVLAFIRWLRRLLTLIRLLPGRVRVHSRFRTRLGDRGNRAGGSASLGEAQEPAD